MRAMISGQRELQEGARWLRGVESRRGLANGDLIRRCRRVQLAGEQATKLGAVAPEECLQNSARVPDCCLYSAVSAVRLALRHGQGTSRARVSAPPAWDNHPATRVWGEA